jgi:hypothetical protein
MDDKSRYKITKDFAEMVSSLYLATIEAGGYPDFDLEHMTAIDLIAFLAPNNIRFVYVPPSSSVKERLK